jgi:hypothetical protein
MFKKSLLALTVAGASAFTANAGILSASITETAERNTALTTSLGGTTATSQDCDALATTLGVTADDNGNTPAHDGATNDTVTVAADAGTAGLYETTADTVVYTGDDACTITINQDVLVDASSVSNSLEGAQANGVTVTGKLISGVGGFSDEDTIRITVSGGVVDEDASAGATLTTDQAGGSTFSLLGVVGNEILFTVTAGGGIAIAREVIDIDDIVVIPNDGVEELALSAETQNTANVVYDTTDEETVTALEGQWTASVDALFDGVIDVATERLSLAVNADDASNALTDAGNNAPLDADEVIQEDTFVFSVAENTAQGNLVADSAELVITGDFAWMAQLDTSDDDTAITSAELQTGFAYQALSADFTGAGNDAVASAAINEAMTELTVTLTTTGGLDAAHAFNWVVPGDGTTTFGTESFNEQNFTAALTITDDSAADGEGFDAPVMAATEAGSWTLNGSVVTVPYMPFGPNTKVIMRHTNTGVQEGAVTVRYMLEDDSTNWVSVGEVATSSRGVMDIRDAVIDAIMADAGVEKGKVAIEITTNVPEADVTVYAGYTVKDSADDRGFVGTFGNLGAAQN